MENFGPEGADVTGKKKIETTAGACIYGFVGIRGGSKDEELSVEEEPVEGVVVGFPLGLMASLVVGVGGLVGGAGGVASSDDIGEE